MKLLREAIGAISIESWTDNVRILGEEDKVMRLICGKMQRHIDSPMYHGYENV